MSDAVSEVESRPDSLASLGKAFVRSFDRNSKQCDNARFLMVDVPLIRREAKAILPFGMWPSDPPLGTLFIVNYVGPTFTVPYREAGMMIHVRSLWGRGWHCCWMVLDPDDTALIYGREMLAYPKKLARIAFDEDGDEVAAGVTRRGVEVLSIHATKGVPERTPRPVFDVKTFNVGGMGQFLAANLVWCFRITERIRESYSAPPSLVLRRSASDPIARLVSGEPLSARFVVTDVTGARYLFPAGVAGPRWFARTYAMRYR